MLYYRKGTTAHKGLTDYQNSKATLNRPKYQGGFCYVRLLTKRKNECKQCQKEKTKSHHILKIKMIFHRHHPHSFGMRSTHPVTRLFHVKILPHSFGSDNSYMPHHFFTLTVFLALHAPYLLTFFPLIFMVL